jgi:hypothetical protein
MRNLIGNHPDVPERVDSVEEMDDEFEMVYLKAELCCSRV